MSKRKFTIGDPVLFPSEEGGMERGVVVRYEYHPEKGKGRGRYVMLRRYGANRLYGETVTRDSYVVIPDQDSIGPNKSGATIVRNNAVILDRGCSCNCCIHTAMRPSDVRQDGSFTWEDADN